MLAALILVFTVIYFLYHHVVQKRKDFPKGPTPWPIIGNIFQLDRTGDTYAGRYGNFVLEFFVKGKYGIVLSEGSFWKEQRRFSLHVLRDFGFGKNIMEEKIYEQVYTLVDHIKSCLGSRTSALISLKNPLELCVGNIINSIVFGYTYKEHDPKFVKMKAIMDDNMKLLSKPTVLLLTAYPFLRFIPLFGNFGFNAFKKNRDRFHDFLEEQIQDHKRDFNEAAESQDFTTSYWKEMVRRQQTNEDIGSFSHHQLKMTIGDLWGAGLETTVTTLKWGILLMLHNPDVQEKCAREISNFLGDDKSKAITMGDRNSLPHTAATVNEIQRVANLLPINIQRTVTQDTVLEGHFLKRGTIVLPQISCVMSDPKVFPDPDRFDPERFLENGVLKKVEELIPFSVGKRACMGESLAKMELFLIFAELIRHFRFSPESGKPLPTLKACPAFIHEPQEYQVVLGHRD